MGSAACHRCPTASNHPGARLPRAWPAAGPPSSGRRRCRGPRHRGPRGAARSVRCRGPAPAPGRPGTGPPAPRSSPRHTADSGRHRRRPKRRGSSRTVGPTRARPRAPSSPPPRGSRAPRLTFGPGAPPVRRRSNALHPSEPSYGTQQLCHQPPLKQPFSYTGTPRLAAGCPWVRCTHRGEAGSAARMPGRVVARGKAWTSSGCGIE